ncbi:MAG: hypothetical protein NVS9B10_27480 [Nevskia sp.]
MPENRIIYDFGSNNGDDIPYYLKKASTVVAIEANPSLCRQIEQRFAAEIAAGRLFVENCVLTTEASAAEVGFYIHRDNHVLSQFPQPDDAHLKDFERVLLPSRSVLSLIAQYGAPHYIKVDIEHYDEAILHALFEGDIRPPYISAESHSIEVFAALVALGRYKAFKLIDGRSVEERFLHHPIDVAGRVETYSFPFHSAGPFGEDIPGDWMSADNFFLLLAQERLGWKDIHATNQVPPNPAAIPVPAPVPDSPAQAVAKPGFIETLRRLVSG